MSAERYEIFDEGSQIRILYSGSISTIISGPLGTHIEDAVIGAIRQQARDIECLQAANNQWRVEVERLRADLATAVAERDEWNGCAMNAITERDTLRARLAAIDGAPTVAYVNSLSWHAINYLAPEPLPPQDRLPIGTELIARPAKES